VRDQRDDFRGSFDDLLWLEAGGSEISEKRSGEQLRETRRPHRAILAP